LLIIRFNMVFAKRQKYGILAYPLKNNGKKRLFVSKVIFFEKNRKKACA